MIIVEGCELSGRQSAARKIATYFGFEVASAPLIAGRENQFHRWLPMIKPNIVYAGFHLQQIVKDSTKLDPFFYTALDRMLLKRGAVIVVLSATEDVIRQRFHATERTDDLDRILYENQMYSEAATTMNLLDKYFPFVHVNIHSEHIEHIIEKDEIVGLEHLHNHLKAIAMFLATTREVNVR